MAPGRSHAYCHLRFEGFRIRFDILPDVAVVGMTARPFGAMHALLLGELRKKGVAGRAPRR
jgi:hypothetical protein